MRTPTPLPASRLGLLLLLSGTLALGVPLAADRLLAPEAAPVAAAPPAGGQLAPAASPEAAPGAPSDTAAAPAGGGPAPAGPGRALASAPVAFDASGAPIVVSFSAGSRAAQRVVTGASGTPATTSVLQWTAGRPAAAAAALTSRPAGGPPPSLPTTVVSQAPVAPPPAQTGNPPSLPTTVETAPPPARSPAPPFAGPWRGAGAFVWHETALQPEAFARTLRENGFAWAALQIHDGEAANRLEHGWIERYHAAGGPPLGGWGVLRHEPEAEARLAASLVRRLSLPFYVANAEAEYGVHGDTSRSGRFVAAFRAALPGLPAALSTTCGPGGVDLGAWRNGAFALLPQAYVNEFGDHVDPGVCVAKGEPYGRDQIHPTVGSYRSNHPVEPAEYGRLLAAAGTVGFSIYLAETDMTPARWTAYGGLIRQGRVTG